MKVSPSITVLELMSEPKESIQNDWNYFNELKKNPTYEIKLSKTVYFLRRVKTVTMYIMKPDKNHCNKEMQDSSFRQSIKLYYQLTCRYSVKYENKHSLQFAPTHLEGKSPSRQLFCRSLTEGCICKLQQTKDAPFYWGTAVFSRANRRITQRTDTIRQQTTVFESWQPRFFPINPLLGLHTSGISMQNPGLILCVLIVRLINYIIISNVYITLDCTSYGSFMAKQYLIQ